MEERSFPSLPAAGGAEPRGPGRGARALLLISAVATVALYLAPFGDVVGYPLLLLSTYAHEMGHGIAAVLVGGQFESLRIFPDASGVALIAAGGGRVRTAVTAAGGLVGPALLAGLLFPASARPKSARFAVAVLGLALLASCLLVVRNLFGLLVASLLGLVLLAAAVRSTPRAVQAACGFVAVQLSLTVFSRGEYLFTETARTATGPAPSDVANMAAALWLPYWFWGAVCGLVSVLVLVVGLWMFWRASARR